MKKFFVMFLFFGLSLAINAQGLLSPVSSHFPDKTGKVSVGEVPVLQKWIPRLNTGVMGVSFGKDYGPVELSAIGFGISYLHYKNMNTVPFNDFGLNLLYLKNTGDNGSGLGIYVTYNISDAIGLLNVGSHYDFFIKKFLVDTGVTFHF